jgi:hypothetical protein
MYRDFPLWVRQQVSIWVSATSFHHGCGAGAARFEHCSKQSLLSNAKLQPDWF